MQVSGSRKGYQSWESEIGAEGGREIAQGAEPSSPSTDRGRDIGAGG